MLATIRGLISRRKLLLKDEPSEGLAPLMVRQFGENIKHFKEQGLTILLVEQKPSLTYEVSDHVYVMSKGRIAYHLSPDD
jgi:branched-chain amino acid transport system ATP-binding protein